MMMDFIVKHQIMLLYICMGLIVIQAYLQEESMQLWLMESYPV